MQHVDDTIILPYKTYLQLATQNLERFLKNEKHHLNLNHSNTEYIILHYITSKKIKLEETKNNHLLIGNHKTLNFNFVKYLGIYLDCA